MYQTKDFSRLKGLSGFSDKALEIHFKLYTGYVANTNKLIEKLNFMLNEGKTDTAEYAELKRRFGWEFNGLRLHEYYFDAMTKNYLALDENSSLYKKITQDFGSFVGLEKDFVSTAAMRGIGWTILYHDQLTDRLFNIWVNEHDVGHLAGTKLLLNLDVFEHAYLLDYGTNRVGYINSFIKTINWAEVQRRHDD